MPRKQSTRRSRKPDNRKRTARRSTKSDTRRRTARRTDRRTDRRTARRTAKSDTRRRTARRMKGGVGLFEGLGIDTANLSRNDGQQMPPVKE